ncbi:undecaprenyl-diphosphate phosphatase [Glycomyces xiaoerkulensis]|uniref:undecaprenyl-diphosphate phosphatase n=1 Tax=Glycomyces xiaoerkulensis TaxID=2038139 RepID=UPI000C260E0E|nr:undecaprenyl-diphosphate phosphatase [Glycomyces xiaoerkulensis]
MEIWQAFVLGIVEGLTEFLPVSSTGHIAVFSAFIGLDPAASEVIAFNAVIQGGAILALLVYFFADIVAIVKGFFVGLFDRDRRGKDYRMGWYVIIGSVPIVIVGLLVEDHIDRVFNLYAVGIGAIGWSFVMWFAEHAATQQRSEGHINLKDALFVGGLQVLSLFPGVSRSGATMTAGLLRDLDRPTATRFAFFLGIPALVGAGVLEMEDAVGGDLPLGSLIVGIVVSAVVAYVSVAWLMRFVAGHTFMPFVWYRIAFGVTVIGIAAAGLVPA